MKTKKTVLTLFAAIALLGTINTVALNQSTSVQASPKIKVKKHKKPTRKKNSKRKSKKHTKKVATKQNITSSSNNDLKQLTDSDVVGVWVNHINTDIHQQITFHANHTWNENQHGVTNIYHGTWKIIGNRKINLKPYDEDIVFTKGNFKRMTVVSYNHVLTKSN